MMLYGLLTSWPVIFMLGMLSLPIFKAVLPLVGRALRPVLRAIIREGILIQRQVQAAAQEAWQDIEDITAEAQADLERRERGNGTVP
jgi:glucose dehydrogenase